jgi:hypothetical protein
MDIVLGLHTEPDPDVPCMLEVDSKTLRFELEVFIDDDEEDTEDFRVLGLRIALTSQEV